MKTSKLLFLLVVFCILSCSKKEEDNVAPNSKPNYTPMSVGNYWVYDFYDIDSLGNESKTTYMDCVYISQTIDFEGNKFYQFEGTYYPTKINPTVLWVLRDSSGYLVDTSGTIYFSATDYRDTLESRFVFNSLGDTLVSYIYQMREVNGSIEVPAGSFSALNYHGTVTGHSLKPISGVKNPRSWNCYYSPKVGKILETFFTFNQYGYSERRLVRYKVK